MQQCNHKYISCIFFRNCNHSDVITIYSFRIFFIKRFFFRDLMFLLFSIFSLTGDNFLEKISWFFIMTAISSFTAMNYTGLERLRTIKKKIQDQEQNIKIIENKLIERDSKNRVTRVNNVIGQYKLTSGFDDTKKFVHSLIKRITIEHNPKENAKGGYFLVKIAQCSIITMMNMLLT